MTRGVVMGFRYRISGMYTCVERTGAEEMRTRETDMFTMGAGREGGGVVIYAYVQ